MDVCKKKFSSPKIRQENKPENFFVSQNLRETVHQSFKKNCIIWMKIYPM